MKITATFASPLCLVAAALLLSAFGPAPALAEGVASDDGTVVVEYRPEAHFLPINPDSLPFYGESAISVTPPHEACVLVDVDVKVKFRQGYLSDVNLFLAAPADRPGGDGDGPGVVLLFDGYYNLYTGVERHLSGVELIFNDEAPVEPCSAGATCIESAGDSLPQPFGDPNSIQLNKLYDPADPINSAGTWIFGGSRAIVGSAYKGPTWIVDDVALVLTYDGCPCEGGCKK